MSKLLVLLVTLLLEREEYLMVIIPIQADKCGRYKNRTNGFFAPIIHISIPESEESESEDSVSVSESG